MGSTLFWLIVVAAVGFVLVVFFRLGLEAEKHEQSFVRREGLLVNHSWDEWPPEGMPCESESWPRFRAARDAARSGDDTTAKRILREIVEMPEPHSIDSAYAWRFYRELGGTVPPEVANDVLGVVVENMIGERRLDIVAAYADQSALYHSHCGAGVIVEYDHELPELEGPLSALLEATRVLPQQTKPSETFPEPPPTESIRLTAITPGGLVRGEPTEGDIENDPVTGPIVRAAVDLMVELMKKPRSYEWESLRGRNVAPRGAEASG